MEATAFTDQCNQTEKACKNEESIYELRVTKAAKDRYANEVSIAVSKFKKYFGSEHVKECDVKNGIDENISKSHYVVVSEMALEEIQKLINNIKEKSWLI